MQKMFTVGQRKRGSQQMQKRKVGCTFVFCSQVAEMQRRKSKWEKLSKIVIAIFFIALPLSHPQHHYLFTCKGRGGENWRANRPLSTPFLFRTSEKVILTVKLARPVLVRQGSPSSSHLQSMSLWVMQPTDSTTHHHHQYHHCHHHHHPIHSRHWPYRYYFAPCHFKLLTVLWVI